MSRSHRSTSTSQQASGSSSTGAPGRRAASWDRYQGLPAPTSSGSYSHTSAQSDQVKSSAGDAGMLDSALRGQPLPGTLAADLGGALGADVSGVRVHTGGEAQSAADGVGARAFAHGQNIFFNQGEYRPESSGGRELIAHEVAHTVQQDGAASVQAKPKVSSPGDACEREADAFASAFTRGDSSPVTRGSVSAATILRSEKTENTGSTETAEATQNPDVTIELGEAPLEPIEISWDPAPFEFGGDAAKAELDLDVGMRFEPDTRVQEGLDEGEVWIDTALWGSASGNAEATARTDDVMKGGKYQDDLAASASVSAGASASGQASYNSRRKHSRDSYERIRVALEEIGPAIDAAFALYRDGVELARGAEKHIAAAQMGAETLEEAFDQAIAIIETGEGMGEWAAEVALLGEVFGEILIAAFEVGNGAVEVVGTLMGNPALARELETGEAYEIRLEAEGAAHLAGEASAGEGGALGLSASGSASAEASWERVFRVEGIEHDGAQGVAILVHFTRSNANDWEAEAGVSKTGKSGKTKMSGKLSLGRAEHEAAETGHKLEVRLMQAHPRFDRLYDRVFSAVTPDQLLALTYDEEVQFDKDSDSGITTLTMDTDWLGGGQTTLSGSGSAENRGQQVNADGSIAGQTSGSASSHVTIDYENDQIVEVDVHGTGESKVIYEGSLELEGSWAEALEEHLGMDLELALTPGSFWESTTDFEYDGKVASLTATDGTVDSALNRMDIALGKRQLEKIALRASPPDKWDSIGTRAYRFKTDAQRQWQTLGANLVKANSAKRTVQLSDKSLGLETTEATLSVLMVGPDGTKQTPMVDGQPYIPPEAARDWRVFLIADILAAFVAKGSAEFGADSVATALGEARGTGYANSGDWQEYRPDYEEIGVEGDRLSLTFSDGKKVTEADLFTVIEDGGYDIKRDLDAAREQASKSIAEQTVRHATTGAALEVQPDENVTRPGDEYLGELSHLLAQANLQSDMAHLTGGLSNIGGRSDYSSMTVFLTDMNTMVSGALTEYRQLFGKHLEYSGYGVELDGNGYSYATVGVEQEDNQSRDTDSEAAWKQVVSMDNILNEAEERLEALQRYQDEYHVLETSVTTKESALSERFADSMKRWYKLNRDFQAIYARYPNDNLLTPPKRDDVDRDLWDDAIVHGRRDELASEFRDGEGYLAGDAAYKGEIADAEGFDPTTGGTELPDAPAADPELFVSGRPYPAMLIDDATQLDALDSMSDRERKKTLEEMRRKHEGLGPDALKSIGEDRADWGFTAGKADYVLEIGARIAHALATGAEPGTMWTIEGHTDSNDTALFNAYLGYRRASAVRNLLVEAGVPPAVLAVRSYGEQDANLADFNAMINGYERSEAAMDKDRRVVVDDDQGNSAVDAMYGEGVDSSNLSLADDDSDRAKVREGQRSDEATAELEIEQELVVDNSERYAALVRDHYGAHPEYITLFTTVVALVGESDAIDILSANPELGVGKFLAACDVQNLGGDSLPHNKDAVESDRSSEISFQPGTINRVDRYTMNLAADIWGIGGLELSWYEVAWPQVSTAIKKHLETNGGPSMYVQQVAAGDDGLEKVGEGHIKPDSWELAESSLSLTFVAGDELGVELLDRMTTDLLPAVTAKPGDDTVGKLAVGAEGESDLDQARRTLRRSYDMIWDVGDGLVSLATTLHDPVAIPARAWKQHVAEHLQALAVDVSMTGDENAAHRLHLGPLVSFSVEAQTGSFDVQAAYNAWLEAQGRESVEDEAEYEDKELVEQAADSDAWGSQYGSALAEEELDDRTAARTARLDVFRMALKALGPTQSLVK